MSSIGKKSYENVNPNIKEINLNENAPSLKDNKTTNFKEKNDFFDEIIKELETNTNELIHNKEKEKDKGKEKENINNDIFLNDNINNLDMNLNETNLYDFKMSKTEKNFKNKEDSQFVRMQKLKEGLQIQPHFDFGIPLNENASLSIIQKYKDKKEENENFQRMLSKINILKWLKVYTVLMNKEIQNVNLCLNQLKKLYSFETSKSSILCEVKNLYIIDCYQLLDVIDANFSFKKIILTKNVKKNSKDKGKIKIFYEYFVNIGDLILFKKPQIKPTVAYGEEYLELDIKDIQKIVPFDIHGESD
jgi:hypothetical protein